MTRRRRRRLTYLTQWFAPEPTAVPVWIAEALDRQGWDVTVVTGVPNYPDGVVLDGYRAWRPMRERRDNISVVRAPLYPSHDGSAFGRIVNYVSWAFSSAYFGRRALRESDAVLVYSSPATAALAAICARVCHGRPFVLLVQDLWPDSIFASGFLNRPWIRRFVEPLLNVFVGWTYRRASAIAVIAPGMRRRLTERGVPADKVQIVYNWVDEEIFYPVEPSGRLRTKLGVPRDATLFLYGGNIGAAQGLESVVDAFLEVGDAAHLALVGDGIRKRELRDRAGAATNVHFHDPVPLADMTHVQADADVLVVSLADDPLFEVTLPSKTQASFAAGRAMLAVANGDVADVVRAAGAGATARPGDATDIARAVGELVALTRAERRDRGQCARRFYSAEMAQAVGASRLSAMLESVAEASIQRRGER